MRTIFLAVTALLSALKPYAQTQLASAGSELSFSDSLRLEFPDQHGLIIVQLSSYLGSEPSHLKNDMVLIDQLLATLEKSVPATSKPMRADIHILPGGERSITIREQALTTTVLAKEQEITQLLPPGWEIVIHNTTKENIYIYSQTFDGIRPMLEFNADAVDQLVKAESKKIYVGRKRLVARMIIQKHEVAFTSVKFQMPGDQLEISALCGFGYVSRTFVPSLGLKVSFKFGNRMNMIKNQYSLIYDNLFFTTRTAEGRFYNRSNSFLSVAYERHFGTKKDFTWLTFGAGYLVYKAGDYFQGKTARLFFSTSVGHFALTPELYLTNDLKIFQTGMKLSYKF